MSKTSSVNHETVTSFLGFLYPSGVFNEDAECTFQIRGDTVYHVTGTFTGELKEELLRRNREGFNIDVLINPLNLESTKATEENIDHVFAFFIDKDDGDARPDGLLPSAKVRTLRGVHLYWKVKECPVEDFRGIQERLISFYQSDPSVKNLNRFMRLPGFVQYKDGQTYVPEILSLNPELTYTLSQIEAAYPLPGGAVPRRKRTRKSFPANRGDLSPKGAGLLESISPEEGGRNRAFYSRARTLAERGEDFDAIQDKAVEVACDIGFPEDEALKAVSNGIAAARTTVAGGTGAGTSQGNSSSSDKDLYQVQSLNLIPVSELLKMPKPDHRWLVEDLLHWGGSSIIAANSKFGKSILARQLTVAVANGEDFLDRRTTPGPVIYLGTEEDAWEVKEHFVKLNLKDPSSVYVHTGTSPQFASTLRQLEAAAVQVKPALIIFDTMVNIAGIEDFNNFSEVYNAVKNIRELGHGVGAHVLCIHHNNKSGTQGLNAMMGSEAFKAAVDTPVVCWEADGKKWIEARPRYAKPVTPTELLFNAEKLSWNIGRGRAEIARGNYAETVWCEVRNFLTTRGEGSTLKELKTSLKKDKARLKAELDSKVEAGLLVQEGDGTPRKPWKYRLPEAVCN